MIDCIPGAQDNRHDFSIMPVAVNANTTLVFKICSYCGTSYRYVDQIWEEVPVEESAR